MMSTKSDYEFLQGVTWYAKDLDGHVGAFDLGQMFAPASSFLNDWEQVDDLVRVLPQFSEYALLRNANDYRQDAERITKLSPTNMASILNRMWPIFERWASELPRRGIFQFKATPASYGTLPPTYDLVCAPLSPIGMASLPPVAQRIISEVAAPIRFKEVRFIDVREWSRTQ